MSKDINEKMYLLYHMYEYGENNENEESKILGIYSPEKGACEAIERNYKMDGFKEYPILSKIILHGWKCNQNNDLGFLVKEMNN